MRSTMALMTQMTQATPLFFIAVSATKPTGSQPNDKTKPLRLAAMALTFPVTRAETCRSRARNHA
jgi:hypothetical protein